MKIRRYFEFMRPAIRPVVIAVVVAGTVAFTFGAFHSRGIEEIGVFTVGADFRGLADGPVPHQFSDGRPATVLVGPDEAEGELRVQGGRLALLSDRAGRAAAYFSTPDLGGPVIGLGARWVFQDGAGSNGAVVLVISRTIQHADAPPVPPYPVHLLITPLNWDLSVRGSATTELETIAAGNFKDPLARGGRTVHEARLSIDGGRVVVELPHTRYIVKDPRVSEWRGNFATFELFSDDAATDASAAFEQVWAQYEAGEQ